MSMNDSGVPVTPPAVPPTYLRPPSLPPSHMSGLLPFTGGIIAIIAILILGYWAYGMNNASKVKSFIPPAHTQVEFTSAGVPLWYEIDGLSLSLTSGPAGFDAIAEANIVEAIESPFSDEHIVLAKALDIPGTVVGIVRSNTRFIPIISDGTLKTDLTARPDKKIAFSVYEDGSKIIITNVEGREHKFQDLGQGRSPRFLESGAIVALGEEGLIRINPDTKARKTLVPREGVETWGAINGDATLAAIPNLGGKTTEIYSIGDTGEAQLLTTIPGAGALASAFAADRYLLILEQGRVVAYSIPLDPQPLLSNGVVLTIL